MKKHIALSILFLFLSFPVIFFLYFLNRIYPGVFVAGINLSGKSEIEAGNLLQPKINNPESITLNYNNKTFDIPVSSLNISFDKDKTIKKAMKLGRSANIILDANQIISSLIHKTNYPFVLNFDESFLDNSIAKIADGINIEPKNAQFTIVNEKVQSFAPESDGLKVNKDELKNDIVNAIDKNEGGKITIDIPTETETAEIKTSDVNNLGIKELIGSGTSRFAGSIGSRIYNINLAASRINNALIAPGDTFSFDTTVGDISALNGYQQAYVIDNGKTVLGDGGGVCQVSTTMFRAAMNSGLPIVERHAHAYRVHYYEEDAPPGMDATIYSPTVDFKFKNDTANYILIQTQIDLTNLVLTFNLYGTKDGRTVDITKPTLWGYQPAPAALYTNDPTLPAGTIKQIDFAASGIKSQFEYTVTKDGQVINHQVFFSDFVPWQAKFLRGTKI